MMTVIFMIGDSDAGDHNEDDIDGDGDDEGDIDDAGDADSKYLATIALPVL